MQEIEFYQLDPELDTFSFAHYAWLEEAQAAGLRHYREHMEIMNSPIGSLSYVKPLPREGDTEPEYWHITDSLHPDRHITMCQIVKYRLLLGGTDDDLRSLCRDLRDYDPHSDGGAERITVLTGRLAKLLGMEG